MSLRSGQLFCKKRMVGSIAPSKGRYLKKHFYFFEQKNHFSVISSLFQAARPLAKRKFRKVRTWKGDRRLPNAETDIWRHFATFAKSDLTQQNWLAKLGGDEVHRMPSHLKCGTSMCDQLCMDNLRPITRRGSKSRMFSVINWCKNFLDAPAAG